MFCALVEEGFACLPINMEHNLEALFHIVSQSRPQMVAIVKTNIIPRKANILVSVSFGSFGQLLCRYLCIDNRIFGCRISIEA